MQFRFRSISSVWCDEGAAARLADFTDGLCAPGCNILLLSDAGLETIGLLEAPIASLQANGHAVTLFTHISEDPKAAEAEAAAEAARACGAELIIGFGGGSPMDVAKIVRLLAVHNQPLDTLYGVDQVAQGAKSLPLILVPTTSGTGSEATSISILTLADGSKKGVVDARLMADRVVLDATLTLTMPPHVTAATGIDAMVHAIEAYTSKIKKNPVSDIYARKALKLIGDHLLTAVLEPENIASRRAMALGAFMAGQAFENAPVAGVHALAYPLGGQFKLTHGLSNSLVLPHVLRFNLSDAKLNYAELASLRGLKGRSRMARAEAFILWLMELSEATGIEQRLRDAGIPHDALDMLADEAMQQERLLVNNPRPISREDALAIYEAAW